MEEGNEPDANADQLSKGHQRRPRGNICLKGYRFNSAAVLERSLMIEGNRNEPYWTWSLTERGRWALRCALISD